MVIIAFYKLMFTVAILLLLVHKTFGSLVISFSINDLNLILGQNENVTLNLIGSAPTDGEISFNTTSENVIFPILPITVQANTNGSFAVEIVTISEGHTILSTNTTPKNMTTNPETFIRISVAKSESIEYASVVIGWLYFVAWSISFYPQTILNYRRKSVIGLNFDYLALNTLGFLCYSLFNVGMYWIPYIEDLYFSRHPHGVNPVQLNDVIFSIHAVFACLIQIYQCGIYDKGDQRVSRIVKLLFWIIIAAALCYIFVLFFGFSTWLDFLYFISYVKLFITLIKYLPQAYYNYRRRSTTGWSIGNIILDFIGGWLSIIQMYMISYNYNDYESIFGDPTKFGLGLFSIFFDVIFFLQHFVFYTERSTTQYEPLLNPDQSFIENSYTESERSNSNGNYGSVIVHRE